MVDVYDVEHQPKHPLKPHPQKNNKTQVCALLWSKHQKELVSSHGFSEYQLCLWKYPSMAKIKELRGHTARVLHLDQVRIFVFEFGRVWVCGAGQTA